MNEPKSEKGWPEASRAAVVLGLCLLLGACAGVRGPQPAPPPPPEEPRTVQGFRIQILTTPEKGAADAQVEQALDWWRALPSHSRPETLRTNELPVDIKWQQPYYRVRIGGFASRAAAERALPVIQDRFPDAFIVPDVVTIE